MSRSSQIARWLGGIGLVLLATLALSPRSPVTGAQPPNAQPGNKNPLSSGLQFVPADAAFFLYVDFAKIWDSPVAKDIRKLDPKTFDLLSGMAKGEFGITPEDVKSVVFIAPNLRERSASESFALVLTFHKGFDKAKLQAGAEKLIPRNAKLKVVSPDDRTALVLFNLKEEELAAQQAGQSVPLSDALKAAASGKYAAVAGITPANLSEDLQRDDLPDLYGRIQPLFKALSITATLDLGKTGTLDVRVKTGTAGQAVDCEKALGAFVALLQEELAGFIKELDVAKDPTLKDLVTLLKAAGTAAKGAKFSTLGNEARLTISLSGDLPFNGAYLAARKKVEEELDVRRSANNLKQIGRACHEYSDSHNGTMPPAAVCDKNGKPILSWRVVILPYIGEEKLYKEFKLDEPWDSDHNKKLLAKMPKVYAIPGKTKPGETDTYYRVFVGDGAGFDWLTPKRFPFDFPDGTSNTILCVTANEAVPWTKPDELLFDPAKDNGKLFGNVVHGRYQVGMFDGWAVTLKKLPSRETINALITRDGGEVIGNDFP
jgi:hypothetical protein